MPWTKTDYPNSMKNLPFVIPFGDDLWVVKEEGSDKPERVLHMEEQKRQIIRKAKNKSHDSKDKIRAIPAVFKKEKPQDGQA